MWNYDIYWCNLILASIQFSTIFFTLFYVKSSNQLQEQAQEGTSKFAKVLKYIERNGILDFVDFVKDVRYAVVTPHKSIILTICLWVSTLFTVIFTTLIILNMSA